MKITYVKNKREQNKFLSLRSEIYGKNSPFVDNDIFMIKEVFIGKSSFTNHLDIDVIYVEDEEKVLCEGIIAFSKELPLYIQLCFFVSRPNSEDAVKFLMNEVNRKGKEKCCKKILVGLNGHVNYGLGFLISDYNIKNSFAGAFNPSYYNDYFKEYETFTLSSYKIEKIADQMKRFSAFLRKIEKNYTFRCFNKKEFEKDAKIYTDLNNYTFNNHKYYYKRTYKEDIEMLEELFLFMKEDSLIFAFDGKKPVAFIMWYPDFNELAESGEAFGAKHYIKNIFKGKKISTAKVMEYGVLEEYRAIGLPLALIHQVSLIIEKSYPNIKKAETSWIMDENENSSGFCKAVCDGVHKRFAVYEKNIE